MKEFLEMKRFTSKLNRFSKRKIEVREFLTEDDDVEASFKKMTSSGVKCDGLLFQDTIQVLLEEESEW